MPVRHQHQLDRMHDLNNGGFLAHRSRMENEDETEILRCSSHAFCPIGADVGQVLWFEGESTAFCGGGIMTPSKTVRCAIYSLIKITNSRMIAIGQSPISPFVFENSSLLNTQF